MSGNHAEAKTPTIDEVESLFVNNPSVDEIRAYIGRFNPIKTMGMEHMEIRHSAILAWLLNPQETHGLGDTFLKAFLSEALRGQHDTGKPSALDVSQADLIDAEVRREWKNIDLLILSPRNGWVFVIENKFYSGQHSNQLQRYMDIVSASFLNGDTYSSVRGVFLSLWEDEPEDERYAPIEYSAIRDILEQQILCGRHPLTAEVEVFLKHYHEIIKEATEMSEDQDEMEKLARQLYRDHKRVLDFIVEHGKSTDFNLACENIFGEGLEYLDDMMVGKQEFVFSGSDANAISFLPKGWYEAFGEDEHHWHGCENWWAGYPLIMWIQLTTDASGGSGQIRLYAEVGPLTEYEFRKRLIEIIQVLAKEKEFKRIKFQRGAADEGKRYSKFLKQNFFPVDDIHDHEKIAAAIQKSLKSFRTEIDAISEVLPQFISYGKDEPLT